MDDMFSSDVEIEEAVSEAQRELNSVVEAAKQCLTHDDFKKYKAHYEFVEREVLNDILKLRILDPTKYGMQMIIFTERLRTVRELLGKIHKDIKRGHNVEEN